MKIKLVLAAFLAVVPVAAQAKSGGAHIDGFFGYDSVGFKAGGVNAGPDGFAFGIGAGYDFPVGTKFVVGPEIEAGFSLAKLDAGNDRIEAARDLYAGVRAKMSVTESLGLYVKGGYTNAGLKAVSGNTSATESLDGFRVGAGVELSREDAPLTLKLEYRYSNYGSYDVGIGAPVKVDRSQVVFGFGYKF